MGRRRHDRPLHLHDLRRPLEPHVPARYRLLPLHVHAHCARRTSEDIPGHRKSRSTRRMRRNDVLIRVVLRNGGKNPFRCI